jgi:PAS domain S-box-containing protein
MIRILSQIECLLFLVLFLIVIAISIHLFKQLYRKKSIIYEKFAYSRVIFFLTVFVIGTLYVLGYFITCRLVRDEKLKIKTEAKLTISAIKAALESKMSKIDAGVNAISGSPAIINYLDNPSEENWKAINSVLTRYYNAFDAYAIYLIDTSGITIASSNYNTELSFVGKDYSFRNYFQESMAGKKSSCFAVGATTGERGYFSSAPVKGPDGKVRGVIAIKYDAEQLDSIFSIEPKAYLVDQNNIVFLSSSVSFNFRPLFPLTDLQKQQISLLPHYRVNSLQPLVKRRISTDEIVMNEQIFIESKAALFLPDWTIYMHSAKESVFRYYLLGFSITLTLILCIYSIINHLALKRIRGWVESVFLSEKRFQTIFEHAPEAIVICESSSGLVISANPLAVKLLDIGIEPVSILQKITPSDQKKSKIELPLCASTLKGLFYSNRGEEKLFFSVSSETMQFRGKNCLVSFLKDISDLIKTQNAYQESERRYREFADFLPEAVFETDLNGFFTYCNKKAFDLFGYTPDDMSKKYTPLDMVIPEQRERVKENLARLFNSSVKFHYEYTALHKSGKTFPILIHSTPVIRQNKITGMCGICIDLTDRVRFEQEIIEKDKLEALGILAGGIAHDFNNLLTAVWTGVSILKIRNLHNSEFNNIFSDLENALQRGKDLTGQLLTYSKGGAPIKEPTSLESLVKDTAAFTISGTQVKCDISSDENLYSAEIDSAQISQVIQNLLINAIEAMPQGGVIKISMSNADNPSVENVQLPPGKYIKLTVSDCGKGIPPSIRQRIFDPFFTTKPKGSGLGLATSYSIIKKHNGHIYLESVLNKGTSFHILLPASTKAAVKHKKADSILTTKTGKILIMDDEPIILTVTKTLLSHLGYTVETAKDGETAIEIYSKAMKNNQRFDAIILDLTVPAGMGGKEAMSKLLEIDPQVNALVSSGYSNDPIMADYKSYGFKGIITKPYNVEELNKSLQLILNEEAVS